MWWCRAWNFDRSQTPVIKEGFELQTSYMQSSWPSGFDNCIECKRFAVQPCCDHWNLCSIKISSTKHHRSFKLNSKLKYFKWVYWFPWNCLLGTGIRYEDICLLHTTLKFRYALLSVYLQILSFCNFSIQKTERLKEVANVIPEILMSELLSNKIFVVRFLNTASVSFFVSRYPFSGFTGKTELIKTT